MRSTLAALALLTLVVTAAGGAVGVVAAQTDSGTILAERFREVLPAADRVGPLGGDPAAAEAYAGDRLAGWVFFTQDVVHSVGYSGKPLNILVGLDGDGRLTGARIIEQHEPILVIGVTDADLDAFVQQYQGLDVREPIAVVRSGAGGVDAVSGATISSTVINDVILRAARQVALARGVLGDAAGGLRLASSERVPWPALIDDGSLVQLTVPFGAAEAALAERAARLLPKGVPARDPDSLFAELMFGLATPERVGASLLGDRAYGRLMAGLGAGDQVIFVGGHGSYSFKGTNWRRDGAFDRLQLIQGDRTHRFAADEHHRIDELAITAAPELRERAVFVLPAGSGFDPSTPFRLALIVSGKQASGEAAFATFAATYQLPTRYLAAPAPAFAVADQPLWRQVWDHRIVDILVLVAALTLLTGMLVFQEVLVRYRRVHQWLRFGFLTFTLVWLGWYATAQLSVLNVLTFGEALRTEFRWEFFLLEPLMFLLWGYVAVALLFWGRGVFCGWLCPFGALQELTNKIARALRIPQLRVPFGLHERLWMIKYVVFLGLAALSLGPVALAIQVAEVEPFKTAVVLKFDRAWPFVLYVLALLGVGLFVERAFCRYLCPLGAALAIPAKLRLFEWLKRQRQCGSPCQICATECPVQAIHPTGGINPNECINCLHCQVNYHDAFVCPPLIERRNRRERRAALIADQQ